MTRGATAQATEAEAARDSFQAAFRRAVLRAAELRAAEKLAEAIAELERIARLAPPGSDEHARLQEVIAESRLEVGEHEAARAAAERALRKLPASPLALRVKRDAIVELGEVATAIPVARELAHADDTPQRWNELVALCHRVENFFAMLQFAEEGLRRHPRTPGLVAARAVAKQHLDAEQAAAATAAARAGDASAKSPWWRRAVDKITGRGSAPDPRAATASLDHKLTAVVDQLAVRAKVVDRAHLLRTLRLAHLSADYAEGKVFALVAALKSSRAIRDLPSDQQLIALLRRFLS
jgi:tetratricopeptide (TPR) repeat protein